MTLHMQRMRHSMPYCSGMIRTKRTNASFTSLLNRSFFSLLSTLIVVPIYVVLHSIIVHTSAASQSII